MSSMLGGQAAARRPAELHGLELRARQHAAADVEDDVPQGGAHGHLDEPPLATLPVSEKILVPRDSSRCPWRRRPRRHGR